MSKDNNDDGVIHGKFRPKKLAAFARMFEKAKEDKYMGQELTPEEEEQRQEYIHWITNNIEEEIVRFNSETEQETDTEKQVRTQDIALLRESLEHEVNKVNGMERYEWRRFVDERRNEPLTGEHIREVEEYLKKEFQVNDSRSMSLAGRREAEIDRYGFLTMSVGDWEDFKVLQQRLDPAPGSPVDIEAQQQGYDVLRDLSITLYDHAGLDGAINVINSRKGRFRGDKTLLEGVVNDLAEARNLSSNEIVRVRRGVGLENKMSAVSTNKDDESDPNPPLDIS